MQDNSGAAIRLIVADVECYLWDHAEIDSQIDTPADGWSLSLFNPATSNLPPQIRGGAPAQIYYGDELILTGIVDSLREQITRSGRIITLSGRDLAGQLIDCSVPIKSAKQVTLGQLLEDFILKDSIGSIIHQIIVQDDSWLKNKISVEPGESLWDAIAKAAQVTGQFIWFEARGSLVIGDPFKDSYKVNKPLRLMRFGINNNVLSLEYSEDVTGVFSEIQLIGQDNDAKHIKASDEVSTPYAYKRLKIITLGDIETQAEAQAALNKIKHDNDLEAYNLNATVAGWTTGGKVWQTGWEITLQSNVLTRANAKWVVMGRTLNLSRTEGKTTTLKLKRKTDWAQPLIYKEQSKKTKKIRKDTSLGLGDADRGTYEGEPQ